MCAWRGGCCDASDPELVLRGAEENSPSDTELSLSFERFPRSGESFLLLFLKKLRLAPSDLSDNS